ncbi:MAG: hypothetical protein ACRC20_09415 [Segniliparus sp.]|uniref:hypothetical protein n=1 Tax=Segniliparus sp. TaxID=2804064 RepID=UPI003F3C6644
MRSPFRGGAMVLVYGLSWIAQYFPATYRPEALRTHWWWTDGPTATTPMVYAMLTGLGAMFVQAAREPAAHRSLIQSGAVVFAAAQAVLVVAAAARRGDHGHLVGDALVGALLASALLWSWRRSRSQVSGLEALGRGSGRPVPPEYRSVSALLRGISAMMLMFVVLSGWLVAHGHYGDDLVAGTGHARAGWFEHFALWGKDDVYGQLFGVVFVVFAVFLWRAASDPVGHDTFILSFVFVQALHVVGMVFYCALHPEHVHHLYQDVALLVVPLLLFAALWTSARRSVPGAGTA